MPPYFVSLRGSTRPSFPIRIILVASIWWAIFSAGPYFHPELLNIQGLDFLGVVLTFDDLLVKYLKEWAEKFKRDGDVTSKLFLIVNLSMLELAVRS